MQQQLLLEYRFPMDREWVNRWITPLIKNPPSDWPYSEDYSWYTGTLSQEVLKTIWLVCSHWTTSTWLQGHSAEDITVGLGYDKWCLNPQGPDYKTIRKLTSRYRENCGDASRWLILKEDTRGTKTWFVIADGNHRAIASVLVGCSDIPVLVAVKTNSLLSG